jgi:hypothetical protein
MRRQFTLTIVFTFWASASAFAQQPTLSLEKLRTVLTPSAYVRVVDRSGKETTGNLAALSDASIQISHKGKIREVSRTEILRIVRIDKDSTLNGTLIGGLVGAGLMTVPAVAQEEGFGSCDYALCAATIPAGFGIGALVGYIADRNITHKETVFDSASQTTLRWNIRPLVTKDKKGAVLVLRF